MSRNLLDFLYSLILLLARYRSSFFFSPVLMLIFFLVPTFAYTFLASYFSRSICNGTIWLSRNFPSSLLLCRSNYPNAYHLGKQKFIPEFLQNGKGFSQLCSEKKKKKSTQSWWLSVPYITPTHSSLQRLLIKNNLPTWLMIPIWIRLNCHYQTHHLKNSDLLGAVVKADVEKKIFMKLKGKKTFSLHTTS